MPCVILSRILDESFHFLDLSPPPALCFQPIIFKSACLALIRKAWGEQHYSWTRYQAKFSDRKNSKHTEICNNVLHTTRVKTRWRPELQQMSSIKRWNATWSSYFKIENKPASDEIFLSMLCLLCYCPTTSRALRATAYSPGIYLQMFITHLWIHQLCLCHRNTSDIRS